jgi:cysteine-rich repeat protein
MSKRHASSIALFTTLSTALAFAACSDDELPPRPATTSSSSSSSSGSGGQGGQGGQGGAGGQGGQGGGQGGQGGGKPAPVCGDGNIDPQIGEECDTGVSFCMNCKLVFDEVEPNGTTAQANAWKDPWGAQIGAAGDVDVFSFDLGAAASVVVETRDVGNGGCKATLEAGDPVPLNDTVVEILAPNGATVITTDDDGGENYCSRAIAPALAPGTYFVRVTASSFGPSPSFPYRVLITQIADTCGDAMLTPGEQCDDGNQNSGDGCSAACKFEIGEAEPNGSTASATPYASPFHGLLSPVGDVDVIAFDVASAGAMIEAKTNDAGLGGCAMNTLDTVVEILDPSGTQLVKNDDMIGLGYCSLAKTTAPAVGQYFARVTGGGRFQDPSYYGLVVTVTP